LSNDSLEIAWQELYSLSMAKTARYLKSRARILRFIRERSRITRSDLASELRLDKKTASAVIDGLLGDRLIVPAGFQDSLAGRRQELFALNGDYGNFLGIDLGGTHIIGILTDFNGRILDRVFFEIRPGLPVAIIIEQMKAIGRKLLGSEKTTAEIHSVGICVPGFIDLLTGTSIIAENIPGWHNIGLKEVFEEAFARPVFADDSSRAFALAEKLIGEGRGKRDFLLVDLGYGIGMAVIANDSLYTGASNKSGEIGHMIVKPEGPSCTCGNRGCLEAVASGRAIASAAALGMRDGRSELLVGLTHGSPETVTAQDVSIAASMGDQFCGTLVREAGAVIGLALANAVNVINPSRVVLGGGLISSNSMMQDSIAKALREYSMREIYQDMDLKVSPLGIDGSALGSAFLAMTRIFETPR
jgi:glucokinase-like ROK family protein